MKCIYILGGGRVGSAMAADLVRDYKVIVVDNNKKSLDRVHSLAHVDRLLENVLTVNMDLLLKDADLVMCAVPGFMGYQTLERVIRAKKDVVDISFFPENPFHLSKLAKDNQVTAVVDCGIAPGLSNMILGRHNEELSVESFECLVGGLPVIREWPFQYKSVFSPVDVIEEYLRPARFVQHGSLVTREALTDVELIEIDGFGTLEAFNSDGLRTLLDTLKIPVMIEKTLRYPGTAEYIRVLKKAGFFSKKYRKLGNNRIRPFDLTAGLLFDQWKMNEEDKDITIMRIEIKGRKKDVQKTYIYDMIDHFDNEKKILSMARTTGYTCTAVGHLILDGKFNDTGICPPEYLGRDFKNFEFILNYLAERNVHFKISRF